MSADRDVIDFLLGFAGAVAAGLIGMSVLMRLRRKRGGGTPKQIVVGDVQALLPRNGAERFWAAFISLNAGLSEELFFRLALPLVLILVFGNAWLAFAIAIVVFGLMHFYQGFAGVIATTVVGAVMSGVYLATGNIWIVVILHAAIDLNGLLLMPYLARRRTARDAQ
jgi:membrane protease YdiL (CAAX protease family)